MTPTHVTGLTLGPTYLQATAAVKAAHPSWCGVTFDEHLGPNTQPILDAYAAAGMHGTFFCIGKEMAENPALCTSILAAGHEIGNHSWSHPHLPNLADHGAKQLSTTQTRMAALLGFTPGTFRPPFGQLDTSVVGHATNDGLATVKWNAAANIFDPNSTRITSRCLAQMGTGVILIMHQLDAHRKALPGILSGIAGMGLTSVPVCQLLGGALA